MQVDRQPNEIQFAPSGYTALPANSPDARELDCDEACSRREIPHSAALSRRPTARYSVVPEARVPEDLQPYISACDHSSSAASRRSRLLSGFLRGHPHRGVSDPCPCSGMPSSIQPLLGPHSETITFELRDVESSVPIG